jgi:hypothetical protein
MVTDDLIKYINGQKKTGMDDTTIKANLLKSNWAESDIDSAFEQIKTGVPTPPPHAAAAGTMDNQTRMILVIVGFLIFYPAGVILMWKWMNWPKWVKILLSIPVGFIFLWIFAFVAIFGVALMNPESRMKDRPVDDVNILEVSPTSSPTSTPDSTPPSGTMPGLPAEATPDINPTVQ